MGVCVCVCLCCFCCYNSAGLLLTQVCVSTFSAFERSVLFLLSQ